MKEKTSAGISGLHFGHMKTCAMDKTLTDFEATLCLIPFTTSYFPDKWRTNVSVMIKKTEQIERVDKLRTIALLEADFNFNNKTTGIPGTEKVQSLCEKFLEYFSLTKIYNGINLV